MNLMKLRDAVIKNTVRPTQEEEKELADKPLRTSRYWEGDSDMGVILFIGIATSYGFSPGELTSFIAVEREQVLFKKEVYDKTLRANSLSGARMRNKTALVKNYLKFYDKSFQK